MKNKNVQWPGYTKEYGSFFIKLTFELAKDFSNSPNERSKRISAVLQNLAFAMREDSKAYRDMLMSIGKFYGEMSEDWNSFYLKVGGKPGSGTYIEHEVDEDLRGIVNQYSSLGIRKIQAMIPLLSEAIGKLSKKDPEAERIRIIQVFYFSIYNGIILQDKWFDKVEDSINSNAQELTLESKI